MTEGWRSKAHRLIYALSQESFERVNRLPNGRLRKRHVAYSIPVAAQKLVELLGANDEEGIKAIFLDYAVLGYFREDL